MSPIHLPAYIALEEATQASGIARGELARHLKRKKATTKVGRETRIVTRLLEQADPEVHAAIVRNRILGTIDG